MAGHVLDLGNERYVEADTQAKIAEQNRIQERCKLPGLLQ
jgi:hypothetical protein